MPDTATPQNTSNSPPFASPSISSTNLQAFLDMLPDALVLIDAAGLLVRVNRQTAVVFGYSRDELEGQPLERLLPARFHAAHVAHRERYFAAPRTRPMGVGLNLIGRRSDGMEFPVEISLSPLLLDGKPHALGAIRDVSAYRAAERERFQQLQQIRQQAELLNLAHDAILVRDSLSRILSWNRGAQDLYGWSEQEVLGRISHSLLRTHFPIDRASVDAQLERTGQWEGELVHTCRDGRLVTVESRQVLVRDEQEQPQAIMEINRDITGRRLQEEAEQVLYSKTAAHLDLLQRVLDALPSAISLVYGPDARLLLANRAATSVWGAEWPPGQPMGEFLASRGITLLDSQGRTLLPQQYATLRAVREGESVRQLQETIYRAGGSSLPVLVNALPLPRQSGTDQLAPASETVALVVHQDVAILKEAEYLKDEFVGIVAHELRTPLAALKGFASMLLVQTARQGGPRLADWQQEALSEIDLAVTRLSDLTEELLDVTRLQTGRLLLHRTPTNLVPLAQRVAAFLQQTSTRHQLEVHTTEDALVSDIDPSRIEQVLTNLIGNAIKYSPQGGPVVITLQAEQVTGTFVLSVQDHGIGIAAGQQGQIFGRFMRADNAVAWGISGTGLGLYICRELVERHGGHLWFESQEGRGSTFFLALPTLSHIAAPEREAKDGGDERGGFSHPQH